MLQPGVLQNQLLQALLQTDEGVVFYLSEDDKGDDWNVVETWNLMGVSLMTSLVILLVLNTSPYSRSTLQFTIVRFFILPPVLKRKRCKNKKKKKNTKRSKKPSEADGHAGKVGVLTEHCNALGMEPFYTLCVKILVVVLLNMILKYDE